MKVLHTADWHIGQLFFEYDRTFEHQQFLDWLIGTLRDEQIDVLLVSGDVFDLSNPSAAAIRMFYGFLNRAVKANPDLQIIITAGNHDSAARLEAPKPLLESSNIHIIGLIERDDESNIDYNRLTIPLKDKTGTTLAWCMAVPFLREGDYPRIEGAANPYAAGVCAFYEAAYNHAAAQRQNGAAIIAMGHLYAQHAELTEMDTVERPIMGGVECIAAAAFHEDIRYVALGHIHKAQRIGGKEHVRYCGSPIPMSFSESNYQHQVVVFDTMDGACDGFRPIPIPVSIPVQRVPAVHSRLADVLTALQQLPLAGESPAQAPYLEVRVLLDAPEPGLRYKIETVLKDKHVRLAKIDTKYPASSREQDDSAYVGPDQLRELQPEVVFSKIYRAKYENEVPGHILQLFHQVAQEVGQTKD